MLLGIPLGEFFCKLQAHLGGFPAPSIPVDANMLPSALSRESAKKESFLMLQNGGAYG